MKRILALLLLVVLAVPARAEPVPADPAQHPILLPVLWARLSAEYEAACWQTYARGLESVTEMLAEPAQAGSLPPAVIMDLDETVLDNAPAGVELIRRKLPEKKMPLVFIPWTERQAALPGDRVPTVPGALDFIRAVEGMGVTVVYITNRPPQAKLDRVYDVRASTLRTLRNLGVDAKGLEERLLMSDGSTTSKQARRDQAARRYRVVASFGDDLNDFVDADGLQPQARKSLVRQNRSRWGQDWFLLPNPVYGTWLDSLPKCWEDRWDVLEESVRL